MQKDMKFYLGIIFLLLSCLIPTLGFWIAGLPLSLPVKGTIIGLLTVGGPEIMAIIAVAMLGKSTFDLVAGKVLTVLSWLAPRGQVSRRRYQLGLVFFILPVVPTYVMSYAPHLLPDTSPERLYVNILADLMFISSLFILGGDFWDKLRALFIFDAKAQFSSCPSSATQN